MELKRLYTNIEEMIEIYKRKYKNQEVHSTQIGLSLLLMEKEGKLDLKTVKYMMDNIIEDKMIVELALIEAVQVISKK